MPAQLAAIRAHGETAGSFAPIDLGAMAEPVDMGQPTRDIGRHSVAGVHEHVERLNEFGAMGVSHGQAKFRSRSVDEVLDQMSQFADSVVPHLQR